MIQRTHFAAWIKLGGAILCLNCAFPSYAQTMRVQHDVHHDVSPALRDLPKVIQNETARIAQEAEPVRRIPLPPGLKPAAEPDPAHQAMALLAPAQFAPMTGLTFEGLGNGTLGFIVNGVPPDTNGAVGLTQYVQWVNTSFAVFDKSTGTLLAVPTPGNTLWTGFWWRLRNKQRRRPNRNF